MPYTGPADRKLPKAVKALPKALRELWVRVFNDSYKPDDEQHAFKMAWGAVNRVKAAKEARVVNDLDMPAWRAWLGQEPEVNAMQTKEHDLRETASQIEAALQRTFPNLIPLQCFDTHVVAASMQEVDDDEGETLDPGAPPIFVRVPYTAEYQTVSTGTEVVTAITFAPPEEWTQVVPAMVDFPLQVKEQADGRYRWLGIASGAFSDRDGEIMSSAWLQSAVDFNESHNRYGEVTLWHKNGMTVADCDFELLVGEPPFLLESGLFRADPLSQQAALYFKEHADANGISIEMPRTGRGPDGVYTPPGLIVRRSFLPRERAAFPWSGLIVKEHTMARSRQEQITYFAQVFGVSEQEAVLMLAQIESGAKDLADMGVRWKEYQAADAAQEPAAEPAPEPIPDAPVTEPAAPEPPAMAVAEEAAPEPTTTVQEAVLTPEAITALVAQVTAVVEEKFNAALSALQAQVAEMLGGLQTLAPAVKETQDALAALKRSDDEKIAEQVANLPRVAIKSLTTPTRPTQRQPDAVAAKASSLSDNERMAQTLHG